mgnify:CR=1 FL=1
MQAIRRNLIDLTIISGEILKKADQMMDKTPLSPINNIVNVALKGVALIFAKMNPKLNNHPYFSHNVYVTHLKSKSFKRCFALMVPGLGFIAVALYDRVKNRSSALKTNQPSSTVAPAKAAKDRNELEAHEKVPVWYDFSEEEQEALNAINSCHKKSYITHFEELTIEDQFRKNPRLILAVACFINSNVMNFLVHKELTDNTAFNVLITNVLEALKSAKGNDERKEIYDNAILRLALYNLI